MNESTARAAWRAITVMAGLVVAFGSTVVPARSARAADAAPKWGAHIDLQGKLGTKRNLGIGDLFLPFAQSGDTLLFGDIRGRFDDRDNQEGNFGLGLRHMLASGWNIGGYGYFDRNSTSLGNDFNQLTFGAEALSLDWDIRANTYWSVGPSTKNLGSAGSSTTASLVGASVQVTTVDSQAQEKAMSGFDAEVGWRVPLFDAEDDRQLRVYLGGYRFAADDVDTVEGPRARFAFTLDTVPFLWEGSRLELTGEIQHDDPRGTQEFAGLQLRIPLQMFGKSSHHLTAQERRMADPIVRDVDIVSQTHTAATTLTETATETAGGSALTVIDSGTITGADLPTAVANAGANSTVILSGTFATTATTTLQSGQTVMGAGSVTVKTPSGRTATLTAPGGTISNTTSSAIPAVDMAANSTLTGMTVDQTGSSGAQGVRVGVSDAAIANNTISVTSSSFLVEGIVVDHATGVTISGNAVTATKPSGEATAVRLNASAATVSGNTLTAVAGGGSTARALVVSASTVTVAGNTLAPSGGGANNHTSLFNTTINAGSTGNVALSGTCLDSGLNTGSIGFTDGSTCP